MRSRWFWAKQACVLLALPVALTNCGDTPAEAPTLARRPLYFDVKGLLDQQVKALTAQATGTTKRVNLRGGATETVRVAVVRWPDELQIFYQADINKAALRGAYTVDSTTLPNGKVQRTYLRRTGQVNAPVSRLAVLTADGRAEEIAADIRQENALFSADKHLELTLSAGQLRRYSVRGTQKLVFFDTLRYGAEGRL